jgi:sugar phosphate isomerase/epimerase
MAAPGSAEVMHYPRCKIADGKTIADAQAWVDSWRKLKDAAKIDYKVRILVPHADNDLGIGEFFLEGRSSTLASYAAAWTWWYSNADAAKSAAQLNAAAACDSGSVYRSTD